MDRAMITFSLLLSLTTLYVLSDVIEVVAKGKRNTYEDQLFYEEVMVKGRHVYTLKELQNHYGNKWTNLRCHREKQAEDFQTPSAQCRD